MRLLPLHTNPFDLGAHVVDDHEIGQTTVDRLDSDELRRLHKVLQPAPLRPHALRGRLSVVACTPMTAAKTFDRATLRVLHPDNVTRLYERVRVIGRTGGAVELYGEAKRHDGQPVDGIRGVVLVARFENATIDHVGSGEWLLRIDADTYRMTRDGRCSTCSRSALATARL